MAPQDREDLRDRGLDPVDFLANQAFRNARDDIGDRVTHSAVGHPFENLTGHSIDTPRAGQNDGTEAASSPRSTASSAENAWAIGDRSGSAVGSTGEGGAAAAIIGDKAAGILDWAARGGSGAAIRSAAGSRGRFRSADQLRPVPPRGSATWGAGD
jgi:hypothetical protein